MSRRINEKFLNAYIEMDRKCCEKFGVAVSGVTEYINRLENARFAPLRDEVLPKLVRYRNIRNVFAHEPSALKRNGELISQDVKWVKRFTRDLTKRKDPISKYLRKARRYARRKRIRRYLVAGSIVLLAFVSLLLYMHFSGK